MSLFERIEQRLYRWLQWRRDRRFAKWRKLHRVMMPQPDPRTVARNWP